MSSPVQPKGAQSNKPVTVPDLILAKNSGQKITMASVYDYPMARLMDEAGMDCLLVGDSLGMVIQGNPDPLSVTLAQMIYHGIMVTRAARRSLVIIDMPFLSYHESRAQALRNAGRILQKTGAHAVKLEGGRKISKTIKAITDADIPVVGHVGLTPQSVRRLGGFKMQRDEQRIVDDAQAVEESGAFAIVLECVPPETARKVSQKLKIPTIGIGAGPHCDGQVLVAHDFLGMTQGFHPRFSKKYAQIAGQILEATRSYCQEVRTGAFPGPEHTFE